MKSHLNLPRSKVFCFIHDCQRYYYSMETLKKHIQKSHEKEYEILKNNFQNKNFTQIYTALKNIVFNYCNETKNSSFNSNNNSETFSNFLNFKDYTNQDLKNPTFPNYNQKNKIKLIKKNFIEII